MFSITFCFAEHFPLENVQQSKMLQMHLMLCKNIFDAKMHFCVHFPLENVPASHFVGAEHFPLENVRVAKMHLMLCKNIFDAKMHFCVHIFTFCWCKNAFDALQKYIFASHFVGAKMHLMPKCILAVQKNAYILFCVAKMHFQMHFCTNKMLQMHLMLPLHFVGAKMHLMPKCILATQNKMLESGKMHFGVHFPKENVQLCKNAFDAKMHLMPKCI